MGGAARVLRETWERGVVVERSAHTGMPRWPSAVALLGIGVSYVLLSQQLSLGPRGLLLLVIVVILVPLYVAHTAGRQRTARWLALGLNCLVTLAVASSAALLVVTLPSRVTPARTLLRDAALIWFTNVVVFALWYWELDGGGPAQRRRHAHTSEDFLFPQMGGGSGETSDWSPTFLDYLFLAFNTSTAFSPTDTAVLSHRAKVLMMAQSLVSLLVIAVLVARAINNL